MEIKTKRAYITTILVVLGVIMSINYVLFNYKNVSQNDFVVINLSGRQRMLIQRITVKLLLIQKKEKENRSIEAEKIEVKSLLDNFKQNQLALQMGSQQLKLPKLTNGSIQHLFNQSQPFFEKLSSYTDRLLNYSDTKKTDARINAIIENQQHYLRYQDLITFKFEEEAQKKFKAYSNQMLFLSILSAALLLLMIPLIFNHILKKLKNANKKLKDSSNKYRQFYHSTPAMMHSIDVSGSIVNVSNYWLEKMGYTEQEVLGKKSTDFLTEKSAKYAKEIILPQYFKTESCKNVPYEFLKKNGEIIHTLLSASSQKDSEDNIVQSHAVITDVTLEKEAELALKANEEKIQALLRANPDVIFRISRTGDFIDFHANSNVLILSPESFRNTNIKDTLTTEQADECLQLIEEAIITGEVKIFHHNMIYKGQQYYFEGRIVKNGENEVLKIVRDITTQKKSELLSSISYNIAMKSSVENVSVQEFCQYVQKQLGQLMDTSEFYISQVNGLDTLTFLHISDSKYNGQVPFTRKQGNGLSEYLVKTKQPLLLNNGEALIFQKEKDLEIYGDPVKSWIGAPLMSSGKPIGIIACQSYTEEDLYDESDLALLSSIGNQIGLWIDRKKVEEDQASFVRIFEKSLHEVYIFDTESLHFDYVNKSSQENLGYTQHELRQLTPLDLKEEFTRKEFEKFITPLKTGKIPVLRFETTHKRKNGTYYPVEIHVQRSVFRGNDVCIATVLDITVRKEAEEEIQEYARFFSLSMDLMCIADINGYFRKVNPLFISTLGYTEEELLTNQFYSFIHPDDIDETIKIVKLLAKGTSSIKITNRYRCKDGSYKWLSWAATPDSKTGLLYATGRDVTELKNAEIALIKSETSLKEAQKITELGSWEWDVKADTVMWSDEHYRIFEIPINDKDITLDRYMSMIHPEDKERVAEVLENSFKNKNSYEITHKIKTANGTEKYVEDRGHIDFDESGEVIRLYGTCMDVSERVQAEKVKEEFTLQLEQKVKERTEDLFNSQKQLKKALSKEKKLGEMKSHFVSTASHQFRTPMAIIQSNSELLNMITENTDAKLKSKLVRVTDRIEKEIKRMTDLMDDVLILGKVTSEAMTIHQEPTNILELCNELIEQFNEIQQDGRKIDFNYIGIPIDINIDNKLISHAIINLLSNAFKYSIKENPKMELLYTNKGVKIIVSDTGIGIPEDEIENLFSPFHRANNVKDIEGTGLGLAISKEYIELNNGKIEVQSHLNKGTIFTITFPCL